MSGWFHQKQQGPQTNACRSSDGRQPPPAETARHRQAHSLGQRQKSKRDTPHAWSTQTSTQQIQPSSQSPSTLSSHLWQRWTPEPNQLTSRRLSHIAESSKPQDAVSEPSRAFMHDRPPLLFYSRPCLIQGPASRMPQAWFHEIDRLSCLRSHGTERVSGTSYIDE